MATTDYDILSDSKLIMTTNARPFMLTLPLSPPSIRIRASCS